MGRGFADLLDGGLDADGRGFVKKSPEGREFGAPHDSPRGHDVVAVGDAQVCGVVELGAERVYAPRVGLLPPDGAAVLGAGETVGRVVFPPLLGPWVAGAGCGRGGFEYAGGEVDGVRERDAAVVQA